MESIPVHSGLSLTHIAQAVRGKLIPTEWAMVLDMKAQRSKTSFVHGRMESIPVHSGLSLTHIAQAVRGKLIPTEWAMVLDMKAQSLDVISCYSVFIYYLSTEKRRCLVRQGC